jgi:hypothetical protein
VLVELNGGNEREVMSNEILELLMFAAKEENCRIAIQSGDKISCGLQSLGNDFGFEICAGFGNTVDEAVQQCFMAYMNHIRVKKIPRSEHDLWMKIQELYPEAPNGWVYSPDWARLELRQNGHVIYVVSKEVIDHAIRQTGMATLKELFAYIAGLQAFEQSAQRCR